MQKPYFEEIKIGWGDAQYPFDCQISDNRKKDFIIDPLALLLKYYIFSHRCLGGECCSHGIWHYKCLRSPSLLQKGYRHIHCVKSLIPDTKYVQTVFEMGIFFPHMAIYPIKLFKANSWILLNTKIDERYLGVNKNYGLNSGTDRSVIYFFVIVLSKNVVLGTGTVQRK